MKIEKYVNEETKHEDFVSRIDFINRTMVFCTPEYFEWAIYDAFKESGVGQDEFVEKYREKYATCLISMPIGNEEFFYELDDDALGAMNYPNDVDFDLNVLEVMNSVALAHSHSRSYAEKMIAKYQSVIDDLTKINADLTNLVSKCINGANVALAGYTNKIV